MTVSDHQPSGTATLEKGLMLFERVLQDGGRTKLTELARDMALPRSTLHRLVAALERQGLVMRVGRGQFAIGLSLVERVRGFPVHSVLAELSRAPLSRLARDCSATAHLGVWEADMVTYLVKVSSRAAGATAAFTRENGQLEAYCSGIGKVLLAHLPEAEQLRYLAGGPFVPLTARTIVDPVLLKQALGTVKTLQFACDNGEIADNLYCLAVPVRDRSETVVAAISLSFGKQHQRDAREAGHLARLQRSAAEIGAKISGKRISRSLPA